MTNGLVLAGGGVAGVAWETGVVRGIADADPGLAARIAGADVLVGTSAGSVVAAQLSSGTPIEELYEAQLRGASREIDVQFDLEAMMAGWTEAATAAAGDMAELRRRLGAMALAAPTVDEAARREVIASRLPRQSWPDGRLLITAVDAASGELRVFDRDSGVGLVDAVAASCAVPGIWPPVTIDGRRYIDGGVRSMTNSDLALGCDRVLVIQPLPEGAPRPFGSLEDELAVLGDARSYVIYADDATVAAFGTNPLSPATRGPAARAGRPIGAAQAAAIAEFWGV
jgi:NTE family protein